MYGYSRAESWDVVENNFYNTYIITQFSQNGK